MDKDKLLATLEYELKAAEAYKDAYKDAPAVQHYCDGKTTILSHLIWCIKQGYFDK
jgi:hypothetical protein